MISTTHHALEWLHAYGRRYPWAWETYAHLLADPPAEWPTWCWCPLAGAYAVLSRGESLTPAQAADVGPMGALAAWRATQGIYRVHPALLRDLLDTPITGDIPADVLQRLPEWCVYVETPGHVLWGSVPLRGFWSHIEHDSNTGRGELRLVLDHGPRLSTAIVHLGGTLAEGIVGALVEARVQALRAGVPEEAPPLKEAAEALGEIAGLVSVLLYLCADDAEVDDRRPLPPRVVQGKKRPLLPSPQKPVVHACGARIGAALEAAHASERHEGAGTGRGVIAHVRRAHWHTYWTGPRDGERRPLLRWLSPILVSGDAPAGAVIRKVEV